MSEGVINQDGVYVQCGPFDPDTGSYAIDGTFWVQREDGGPLGGTRWIIDVTESVESYLKTLEEVKDD